ncbi:hypothetical protein ACFWPK_33430 [Nocardia sp. NPDC058519]|uniref:hypothetical protein n=1 Tax=Nocardia sp. NPDC058519 TaxID=3346535 RepID=UPI00364D02B4
MIIGGAAPMPPVGLYRLQVEHFAPVKGLLDRDGEKEMLAGFCHGKQAYMWVHGRRRAGKTALLAGFALEPPSGVRVVCFFVTNQLRNQNTHTDYTNAVLDQLAVLMPDQAEVINAANIYRDGLRDHLLTLAAERESVEGRRLVLVVDGLDEDVGSPPIVTLLPRRPHPNLRVITASRSDLSLPIPAEHPIATAQPYLIAAFTRSTGYDPPSTRTSTSSRSSPGREEEHSASWGSPQDCLIRWEHPRLGTLSFNDQQTAVEFFKAAGGFDERP